MAHQRVGQINSMQNYIFSKNTMTNHIFSKNDMSKHAIHEITCLNLNFISIQLDFIILFKKHFTEIFI